MVSPLDEALHTFIAESRELLEQMEDALLRIEQDPNDPDIIAAIFRAAHTIKGSAGLFGIQHLVAFTHVAESVLDKVRNRDLQIDSDLVALFLATCDHIGVLIDHVAARGEPDPATHEASAALEAKLRAYLGQPPVAAQPTPPVEHAGRVEQEVPAAGSADTDNWHISLRFEANVLRNGLDPLAFIRYLTTFGRIVHIVTLVDKVPALSDLDPETCYVGFEISYKSTADKATIEGAFEFVRNDATIHILPPHSRIADYLHLIETLPAEEMPLGEILVRCGTLTRGELEDALEQQAAEARATGVAARPIGQVLTEQKLVQPQVVEAALDKQKQVKEQKSAEGSLIRVKAEKLDEHINLIGELIITSASTSLIAQRANIPELFEAAERLSRLVEEIRDSALGLRMVQIGATFNKFQRVVRDVSAELGKDIRLEITGAETELDKTVVEKIGDPLTHLVRNSMDHGIECAETRVARGKPAHGTIGLNAYHDSGSIVIEVSDDGGGLNREKILNKAIERELVKADQPLSDAEIYNLIFEPGFSTADKVNNLSGRGVGMDVVRRNIDALRGTVEVNSCEGAGTTMRVRLPLTLAIIDGFLVGVGESAFVLPLEAVVECVELSAQETEAAQGRSHLNLRGEVLPLIRLRDLFDIPETRSDRGDPEEAMAVVSDPFLHRARNSVLTEEGAAALAADPELHFILHPIQRENVVVVQYAGHRAGLVVERLMGEFQTVIRPLGEVFNGLQGVSGFTLLGSGRVALILDVIGLVRRVTERESVRRISAAPLAVAG
ncbi:MAG TPA: chemotaxis protein CheA [Rhodocyclaceae bacterium]|nr:chemotaxis protein CheA [Rhodocyclaceae bacterium]